jgi:hypothetical protein
LQLLALAGWATGFRDDLQDKSPYREWLKAHGAEVIPNEFGGAYNLRSELLWSLERNITRCPSRIASRGKQHKIRNRPIAKATRSATSSSPKARSSI